MNHPNDTQISMGTFQQDDAQHMHQTHAIPSPAHPVSMVGNASVDQPHRASYLDGFAGPQQALLNEPLKLSTAQSQRLIRAAVGVDASIWRKEMAKLEAQGFTTRNPNWAQVSIEKMIPWFECKAQVVLTTGMPFCEVLELTVGDLQLSECETRLEAVAGHKLTDRCSALLEAVFPLGQLAIFPWDDHAHAAGLWLRACRNAGLLRRHSR